MIRRPAILYPVLQGPTPTTLEKDIEARWHQPLATPAAHLARPALAAAIIAGSLFWSGHTPEPPAETVTLDKYQRPLSEPVRVPPRLGEGLQQALAFVAPAPDAASGGRWLQPLAEPVRVKPRLVEGLQQSLALVQPVPLPDAQPPSLWQRPLAEPVRVPQRLAEAQQQALLVDPAAFTTPGRERWFVPLAEPVRTHTLGVALQQSLAWYPSTPAPSEVVTVDKWLRPFAEPVRSQPRLPEALQQSLPIDPAGFTTAGRERWFVPLSEPLRIRPRLAESLQLALVETPTPVAPTFQAWFRPLDEPLFIRRIAVSAYQPTPTYVDLVTEVPVTPGVTREVLLDRKSARRVVIAGKADRISFDRKGRTRIVIPRR